MPAHRLLLPPAVVVELIAQAIAKYERYGPWWSRATRYHNPGNLRGFNGLGDPDEGDLLDFDTDGDGWRALRLEVWTNVVKRRLSLQEFFDGKISGPAPGPGAYPGFAPATPKMPRRPDQYVTFVLDYLWKHGGPLESTARPIIQMTSPISTEIPPSREYPGLGRQAVERG